MKYASVWWDWWLNSNLLMLALTTLHIVRICNITDHPTHCSTCSGLQMEEDSLLVPPVENFLCGMESTSTLKLWWRWDAVALLHCNPTSLLAPYLSLPPSLHPSLSLQRSPTTARCAACSGVTTHSGWQPLTTGVWSSTGNPIWTTFTLFRLTMNRFAVAGGIPRMQLLAC